MWWMSFLNNHGDDATQKDQRGHRQMISIYCQRTNEDLWWWGEGKTLISDCYWNSHDYHLHDSNIAVYKTKLYKDTRSENKKNPIQTLTLRENKLRPFLQKATGQSWMHTQSLCQTVYNMHTWWGRKLKISFCLMQIYPYCKSMSCLCLGINNFLDADSWIKHLHKKKL